MAKPKGIKLRLKINTKQTDKNGFPVLKATLKLGSKEVTKKLYYMDDGGVSTHMISLQGFILTVIPSGHLTHYSLLAPSELTLFSGNCMWEDMVFSTTLYNKEHKKPKED